MRPPKHPNLKNWGVLGIKIGVFLTWGVLGVTKKNYSTSKNKIKGEHCRENEIRNRVQGKSGRNLFFWKVREFGLFFLRIGENQGIIFITGVCSGNFALTQVNSICSTGVKLDIS